MTIEETCIERPSQDAMAVQSALRIVPSDPIEQIRRLPNIECGEEASKHFSFANGYKNLNHGKHPCSVRSVSTATVRNTG